MADEQLPEGTDRIVPGASGISVDTHGEDRMASSLDVPANSEPASSSTVIDNMTDKGAWFDKVDEIKAQGYDSVRAYAVAGKDKATGALDELIRMVGDAAAQIDAKVGTNYGDYARRGVEGIANFNDALKDKDVDELFGDARALVAKAPAVAVGTAAALGFVIARLARAGMPEADTPSAKPSKTGPAA